MSICPYYDQKIDIAIDKSMAPFIQWSEDLIALATPMSRLSTDTNFVWANTGKCGTHFYKLM